MWVVVKLVWLLGHNGGCRWVVGVRVEGPDILEVGGGWWVRVVDVEICQSSTQRAVGGGGVFTTTTESAYEGRNHVHVDRAPFCEVGMGFRVGA